MVECAEFVVGDSGSNPSVRRVTSMAQALAAHRDEQAHTVRYDLGRLGAPASPLFDHRVLDLDVTTNNIAAFLFGVSRQTVFLDKGERSPILCESRSLAAIEAELLEQAAARFGLAFLEELAVRSADLRRKKIQRMELLRCIVNQMRVREDLRPLAERLEGAIVALNLPRTKHTGPGAERAP